MRCSQVLDALDDYLDGRVPPRLAGQIESHLTVCASCAAELAAIHRLADALSAVPRAEPGADLARRIAARTATLPPPGAQRAFRAGWRRVVVTAAGCLAALGLVQLLLGLWSAPVRALTAWAVATAGDWVAVAVGGSVPLLSATAAIVRAVGRAAEVAAPTWELYLAAEVGAVVATVLVLSWVRSRTFRHVLGLV